MDKSDINSQIPGIVEDLGAEINLPQWMCYKQISHVVEVSFEPNPVFENTSFIEIFTQESILELVSLPVFETVEMVVLKRR